MIAFAELWIGRLLLVGALVGAALWWWVWIGVRFEYWAKNRKSSSRS
jgi:hypothetical protein